MMDFNVGDFVLITGKGNHDTWNWHMEGLIGREGQIRSITDKGTRIQVAIPDSQTWYYWPDNLKSLEIIVPEELFKI